MNGNRWSRASIAVGSLVLILALIGPGLPIGAAGAETPASASAKKKCKKAKGKKRCKKKKRSPAAPVPAPAPAPSIPGTPAQLSISPGVHDFGDQQQGTESETFLFIVSNTGGSETGPFSEPVYGGSWFDEYFTDASVTTCAASLPAGGSCAVGVYFFPGFASGVHQANVSVGASGATAVTANLSGNATS
jgi:hypothetical protein